MIILQRRNHSFQCWRSQFDKNWLHCRDRVDTTFLSLARGALNHFVLHMYYSYVDSMQEFKSVFSPPDILEVLNLQRHVLELYSLAHASVD